MINVNLNVLRFWLQRWDLAILLLNCPSNRAPIVHAEVYCNFDSFPIFLYVDILIISHKPRVFTNVVSVRIRY